MISQSPYFFVTNNFILKLLAYSANFKVKGVKIKCFTLYKVFRKVTSFMHKKVHLIDTRAGLTLAIKFGVKIKSFKKFISLKCNSTIPVST